MITGRSGTNTLIVNPGQSSNASLTPPRGPDGDGHDDQLRSSAAALFPSYIVNRTNQMAIELVQYFNSLPLKLPYLNAPPHTPNNRGAIQTFVYQAITGSSARACSNRSWPSPCRRPPATTCKFTMPPSAPRSSSPASRPSSGVSEVFARQLYISAPQPRNRFGVIAPQTIPAYLLNG